MSRPRIVLMEDDAPISSLVSFALEDMGVDLVICANVPEAVARLKETPAALLIMDLMLPGESGLSFLQRHAAAPLFAATTRVMVFSAGLTQAMRRHLEPLGVWRMLAKPASILTLRACVEDALRDAREGPTRNLRAEPTQPASAKAQPAGNDLFGGNAWLVAAYSDACLGQFPHDVEDGDAAATQGDFVVLRALGHNLKTALKLLGHDGASARAAALEVAAAQRNTAAAPALWRGLRKDLTDILRRHAEVPTH